MELRPYTGSTAPTQTPALRPKLMTWTSRVWRESPGRTIPLFKIDARLEPRDIEDNALSQALRPFSSQLQKLDDLFAAPGGDAAARAVGGGALRHRRKRAPTCSFTTISPRPTARCTSV